MCDTSSASVDGDQHEDHGGVAQCLNGTPFARSSSAPSIVRPRSSATGSLAARSASCTRTARCSGHCRTVRGAAEGTPCSVLLTAVKSLESSFSTASATVTATTKNIGTSSSGSDELQLPVAVAEADIYATFL